MKKILLATGVLASLCLGWHPEASAQEEPHAYAIFAIPSHKQLLALPGRGISVCSQMDRAGTALQIADYETSLPGMGVVGREPMKADDGAVYGYMLQLNNARVIALFDSPADCTNVAMALTRSGYTIAPIN